MKTLFYLKLRISAGMINNLKTRNIALTLTPFRSTEEFKNVGIFIPKGMLIKLTPSNLTLSNLALCLVLTILFLILLNHALFITLHVRAVELVIFGETNRHFNTSLSGQTFPHLCF